MKIRRLQAWIAEQLFGRPLKVAAGAALVFAVGTTDTQAQSWNNPASSNWNLSTNWDTGVVPVSGNITALTFGGSSTYTATNDIGAFSLNSLTISNTEATIIDGGAGLTFAGTTPAINGSSGSGLATIAGPVTYSANTAITNASSNLLTLSGAQTFGANLTFNGTGATTLSGTGNFTGNRTLTNNSTATVTLGGAQTLGGNVTFAGTGSTAIAGASTLTAARTVTNNSTGTITLGDVNLGTFALTVAGAGSTAINGNLTESGAGGSLTTRGNGTTSGPTLTIAGTIGYTGATNINAGGTLAYTSAAASAGMGALNFGSGLGYLATISGQGTLTFSSVTAGTGAFGIIGSTGASKILIGGTPATNDLIAGNLYYGGSNIDGHAFAVIDATTKEVRAMNYATDNGAVISGGTAIPAGSAGKNIDLTTGLSAQQTIGVKSLLADNSAASSLTLATGATLTITSGGLAASNNSTGTFTITGGTAITTGSSTPLYVRTQNADGNFVINTPITGTGGLMVSGQSTTGLTLGAANTFSGDTRIVNSVTTGLSLNHVLALQNSTLDMNADDSGTIGFTATSTAAAPFVLGGLKGARPLALGTAFVSIGKNNQSTTYSGALTGSNGFTKIGTGTLTITGANTFAGNITLSAGTLAVGAATTLGAVGNTISIANGTTFRNTANLTTTTAATNGHIFSLAANATATWDTGTFTASVLGSQLLGGAGSTLNKTGTGTLTVGSSGNATVPTININAGILQVTSNRLSQVGAINIAAGGQFRINDDTTGNFPLAGAGYTLNGNGPSGSGAIQLLTGTSSAVSTIPSAITLQTAARISPTNNANGSTGTILVTGAITGPGSLIKGSTGSLVLSNANNTYGGANGNTTVLDGILQINGGNNRLPTATKLILGDSTANTSGAFDLNGLSQTVAGLSTVGTGNANRVVSTNPNTTGTLDVNVATGSQTFAGILGGTYTFGGSPFSGDYFELIKSGTGNLTLSGANSYTGSTTINAGTLSIANAAALPATSTNIVVAPGGVLDASAVAGGYNFAASQVLTVGRSAAAATDILGSINVVGTFNIGGSNNAATATITGNAGFDSANFQFDLNNIVASGNDLIAVTGSLSLAGTNNFNITKLNGPLSSGVYTLFNYTGALTGGASNINVIGAADGRQSAAIDTLSTPGSIKLNITGTAANLIWSGNASSNIWDLTTTANFNGAANNDNRFYNGDTVMFDNSGIGGMTPVLVTGALSPSTMTVSGTQDYIFNDGGSGNITGTGNINLNGTGAVTLAVPVTSTGTTTLNSGTLNIASGGSISGPVTTTGGTLNANTFNSVSGAFTMTGGTVNATADGAFNGSIEIDGGTFLAVNPFGNAINSSSISVTGPGVLQLGNGGTEGYINGPITLSSGGTLAFNHTDTVFFNNTISGPGNIANNGTGEVNIQAAIANTNYNFTGTGSGKLILSGNLSGSTSITQSGSGTTKLTGTNTQTGAINITGGTLEVGILSTTGNAAAMVNINGGTYYATVGQNNTQAFNIGSNGGTIRVNPDFVLVKGTNGINGVGNTLTITGGGTIALQGSGSSSISNVIVESGIWRHTSVRYVSGNITTPYTIDVKQGSTLYNLDTTSFGGTSYFPFGNITGTGAEDSKITLNGDGAPGGGGVDTTTMFGAYLHVLGEESTAATNAATTSIKVPVILAGNARFTLVNGTDPARTGTDRITDSLIGGVSGPGGLIVDGDGNGTLAINNVPATYLGATRVANGTLRIGMDNGLPTTTTLILGGTTGDNVMNSSGTFELNGKSQTVAGLGTTGDGSTNRIGNAPNTDGALIVNYNGGSPQTFSGAIGYTDQSNAPFRNLSLTKDGTGTLILSGTNDYTRATTVNAGTLVIANAASLPSNTAQVTVASGAVLDVSGIAGGYTFMTGRTLTLGRTTAPANDLIGSANLEGNLNIGGTNIAATATIFGDLTLNSGILNYDLSNSLATGNDLLSINGNLNANGLTTFQINQTGGPLAQGNYTLLNYTGTFTGSAANFGLSGIATVGTRATYSIDSMTTAGSILLHVTGTPANLTWVGNAGNNTWDLINTVNFTGATDSRFYNGDTVLFSSTGIGAAIPVTVNDALSPATITVNGTKDYTFSGTGNLTTTSLTKDGSAALTLQIPVTSNSTSVNAGTLTVETGGSVSGPVNLTGGTLNANVTGALNDSLTVTGGTLNATASQNLTSATVNSGTVNMAAGVNNAGLTTVSGGTLALGAASTLTGGLNVSGGLVTLSAANTIGAVNLTGGTTQVAATDALGAVGSLNMSGGALLQATASQTLSRNMIVGDGGGTVNVSGSDIFQWNGSTEGLSTTTLTKTGSGTLAITGVNGANGGFTGTLDINAGTVVLTGRADAVAAGDLSAASILVRNGAKFQFGVFPTLTGNNPDLPGQTAITLETGGTIDWHTGEDFGAIHLQGGSLNLLNGGVNLAITNNWTNGTITGALDISGNPAFGVGGTTLATAPTNSIAIQKMTTGTVTITDANLSISGAINIAEGTISTNAGITSNAAPLNLGGTTTNGTFQLRHMATASFAKPVNLNAGGGTLDVQNATGNITWSGVVSGTGNFTKSGLGTLRLTGTNTYTGQTNVTAGKLLINGNSSAATGNVNVSALAAIGGSGSVGGLTTLANTAIVAPGNSTGNLTFAAGANLSAGGVYQWELGSLSTTGTAGQNFDIITVSGGNLTLGGTSALTLDFGLVAATGPNSSDAFWNTAQTWKIIDVSGTATNVGGASLSTITNAAYSRGTFSTSVGSAADAGDIFLVFTPIVAGASTWQGANNENWTAAASWSGVVPNSAAAEAKFVSTGGTTANLDANQTVNKLTFDSTVNHAVSGSGKLTLTGITPSISTAATNTGSQTVATNLDLAAGTTIAVNGGTLNLNAPTNATLGSGVTATVATGATLTLGGTGNALSNGTTTHANVTNNGTLVATTAGKRVGHIDGTGTTNVTAAGASLTSTQIKQANLSIGTGNTVSIAANGTKTSILSNSLSIASTPSTPDNEPFTPLNTYGGTLDLADNNLLVRRANQGVTLAASVRDMVLSGFNPLNGFWDGTGLKSSIAAANPLGNTALAVVLNSDSGFPIFATGLDIGAATGNNEFASAGTLTADDVIVRYTYFGDANLDGIVDGDDQSLLDTGFAGGGTGWFFGDFNYDGLINGDDQSLLDSSFGQPALLGGGGGNLMSLNIAAVPEPGSIVAGGLTLLGLTGLQLRRRRQQKE